MALLQNDKAIFYHPCDDSTESLKSQAWTESTPTYVTGKVSDALSPTVGDSISSFGTESEFLSAGSATSNSVVALDSTKFVVAYSDGADAGHGTARVGTVSGTDITFGAASEFLSAGSVSYISVTALSSTVFVVAYRDEADSNHGTAKVGTVSGTAITFGAETEFLSAGGVFYISAAALDSTKFVVAYSDQPDSFHGTAKVGTVSGTDITFGAEAEFNGTGSTVNNSVTALSSTVFVVAYTDGVAFDHGRAKVGTVSGTDITFGAVSDFNSAGTTSNISVAALSSTVFVVAYRDEADSNHGTAKVGTVSGTAITFGAEAEFLSADGATAISAAALSSTVFVVSYTDQADSNHGTSKVGTVSGTAVTFGAETEFLSANGATDNSIAALSTTTTVVAYRDAADSGHGTAKVGPLPAGASLTASTPAAYDSAVAATKVAFCGWLKNPST